MIRTDGERNRQGPLCYQHDLIMMMIMMDARMDTITKKVIDQSAWAGEYADRTSVKG